MTRAEILAEIQTLADAAKSHMGDIALLLVTAAREAMQESAWALDSSLNQIERYRKKHSDTLAGMKALKAVLEKMPEPMDITPVRYTGSDRGGIEGAL